MLTIQNAFPVIFGLIFVGILLTKRLLFDKSNVEIKSVILSFLYGPMVLAGFDCVICVLFKKPFFYSSLENLQVPIVLGGVISVYFGLYLFFNEINTPSHPEQIDKDKK